MFGAGYQSLPTMSEEEFFQKEIREGKIVMEYKRYGITHNEYCAQEIETSIPIPPRVG